MDPYNSTKRSRGRSTSATKRYVGATPRSIHNYNSTTNERKIISRRRKNLSNKLNAVNGIPSSLVSKILDPIERAKERKADVDELNERLDRGFRNLSTVRKYYSNSRGSSKRLANSLKKGSPYDTSVSSVGDISGAEESCDDIFEFDDKADKTTISFSHWMEKFRSRRGDPWNLMRGFKDKKRTKYCIASENSSEFWTRWCDEVSTSPGSVSLQERVGDYFRVVADIDFRSGASNVQRLFKKDHCRLLVKAYIKALREICVDIDDKQLHCLVLTKGSPVFIQEKQIWKDGIHLSFPNVVLPKWVGKILHQKADAYVQQWGIFSDVPYESVEVDKQILSNSQWYLYGSAKGGDDPQSYEVKYIYNYNLGDSTLTEVFPMKPKGKSRKYWLPFMLKNEGCEPNAVLKDDIQLLLSAKKRHQRVRKQRDIQISLTREEIKGNIEVASNLLKIVKDSRADDYNEWLRIGMILFDISDGSEEGLEQWDELSIKSDKSKV